MRIISGRYKGRTIATVRDLSVRPATDRVRETIFNILSHRMDLSGSRVLDLFAGSGSLGLEALSREASHAVFVENSRGAVQHLRDNVRTLGCESEARIVEMDSIAFLGQADGRYDVVFADPPYEYERTKDLSCKICITRFGTLLNFHTLLINSIINMTPQFWYAPHKQHH